MKMLLRCTHICSINSNEAHTHCLGWTPISAAACATGKSLPLLSTAVRFGFQTSAPRENEGVAVPPRGRPPQYASTLRFVKGHALSLPNELGRLIGVDSGACAQSNLTDTRDTVESCTCPVPVVG